MVGVQGDTGVTQWHLRDKAICPAKQLRPGDVRRELYLHSQRMGTSSKGIHVAFVAQLGLGTWHGVPGRLGRGVTGGCMGFLVPAWGGKELGQL